MPPFASSNLPILCLIAEVNAPFSCPKSSLSINSDGIAAQFTSTSGPFALLLFSCNHLATNSLPDPFSPVIRTLASVGATFSISDIIFKMGSDSPTISIVLFTFFFKTFVSIINSVLSIAFRMVIKSRFKSGGLGIKSNAPFFTASTAVSIFPCPDKMISGTCFPISLTASSTSMPSFLGIFISQITTS